MRLSAIADDEVQEWPKPGCMVLDPRKCISASGPAPRQASRLAGHGRGQARPIMMAGVLVRSGIRLVKYWFSITDEEQQLRFLMRVHDPMKQWKLSPMDLQITRRRERCTKAREEMFERTSIAEVLWYIVEGNDKKRARLNCIDRLLRQMPHEPVPHEEIDLPDRVFNLEYERQTLPRELYVSLKY